MVVVNYDFGMEGLAGVDEVVAELLGWVRMNKALPVAADDHAASARNFSNHIANLARVGDIAEMN